MFISNPKTAKMLSQKQEKFKVDFLNIFKQRFYFLQNLPMALLSGTKLVTLDDEKAVSTVPFFWWNKNPFKSIYFAVLSMAAELSTAAPAMLALKGTNANIALIITETNAVFVKKAQSKIIFTCTDYSMFNHAMQGLTQKDDSVEVKAKTVGRNAKGEEVATFYFTWSFKRRD